MIWNLEKYMKDANKTYKQVSRETKIPQDRLWDLIHSGTSKATKEETEVLLKCLGIVSFILEDEAKVEQPKTETNDIDTRYSKIISYYDSLRGYDKMESRIKFSKQLVAYVVRHSGLPTIKGYCDKYGLSQRSLQNWLNGAASMQMENLRTVLASADDLDIAYGSLWMAAISDPYHKKSKYLEAKEDTDDVSKEEKPVSKNTNEDKITKMIGKLSIEHMEEITDKAFAIAANNPSWCALIEKYFWEDI